VLSLIVRSKRDADALKNMLENYHPDWKADVTTLKGTRGLEILDKIREITQEDRFYLVLLGKEERDVVRELSEKTPNNVIVHMVNKRRLRNTRLRELNWELEVAKVQPRLWFKWNLQTPFLAKKFIRGEPGSDLYVAWGLWWKTLGLGEPSHLAFLLKRGSRGYHEVYSQGRVAAIFELTDDRAPKPLVLDEIKGFELSKFVELSLPLLESFIRASSTLFKDCERALVPWSGGKDSTAALILAKEHCDEVVAVYVDTGVDMALNKYYIELLANKLNVEYILKRAPVYEEISKRGFPTKENRWCTGLKLKALEEAVREVNPDVIVVGDRDAESSSRSNRWLVREWEGVGTIVSPLKLWNAAMVEVLLLSRKVPLNPLYPLGFYRLGCYVCPFLRKYERTLLEEVKAARISADLKLLERYLKGAHSSDL